MSMSWLAVVILKLPIFAIYIRPYDSLGRQLMPLPHRPSTQAYTFHQCASCAPPGTASRFECFIRFYLFPLP
ncbi:MAG: hypothetical protein NXY57DRAFT_1006245 [Lentinula lateritia]|uniref:Secreted protein n=1 Tax=Lentinula lateritia TaxID=40482 RepID=A0ABQ8VI45_9AGAR|nr:MAG: hypothetical protein NXY57DRAFT_1006245 [Lentinula lateritia]KAJ4495299.1 hypothetical protein C8R41DRAFT_828560 [Lentinula lateritia]